MDEKDFKKHLQDLAHGHHHPEEHDWPEHGAVRVSDEPAEPDKRKPHKTVRKPKQRK